MLLARDGIIIMRAIVILSVAILVAGCSGDADRPWSALFGADEKILSEADQQAVFLQMSEAFPLSDDGTTLVDPYCGDIAPMTDVIDLNGDGNYEVFVEFGNSCISGFTGRSLSLFIKDENGNYQYQLGFPAMGYQMLERGVDGYPDLQFGGPGFCFPVWAWDGSNYEFKCSLPQADGGCENRENVCPEEN